MLKDAISYQVIKKLKQNSEIVPNGISVSIFRQYFVEVLDESVQNYVIGEEARRIIFLRTRNYT